jgi:hypothetical protein
MSVAVEQSLENASAFLRKAYDAGCSPDFLFNLRVARAWLRVAASQKLIDDTQRELARMGPSNHPTHA